MNLAVPEDISIIGCADLDFARMLSEPLTSINQDSYGMGKRGVQLGIDRLEGRSPAEPVRQVHPHKLIERMTTRGTAETRAVRPSRTIGRKNHFRKKTVLT